MATIKRRLLALLGGIPTDDHKATQRADRERYRLLWDDHLARCNCHDSWDQCPCTSVGHIRPLDNGESVYPCANKCCRWC